MPWLRHVTNLIRRSLISRSAFLLYGLIIGSLISIPLIYRPEVAVLTISGPISQASSNAILDTIRNTGTDSRVRAVVLEVDSPGGESCAIEQIYLELLRLREKKPIVATIDTMAASGGYYVATAADYIYGVRSSQIGSIGAWVNLPQREELDENRATTGLFKATSGSRRKAYSRLEMLRKQFVTVVKSARGNRLKLSEQELCRAEIYLGTECVNNGLIDAIGTKTDALQQAAKLAHIRNYRLAGSNQEQTTLPFFLSSSDLKALTMDSRTVPVYYYLYFESE